MALGCFNEEMFRGRPHSIRLQLVLESDGSPVEEALANYTHRLIFKKSPSDPDSEAIFNLTNIFTDEDDTEKIVEALIPMSATDVAEIPEGRMTRGYLQWQTTDSTANSWIVASGTLTVQVSLPYTP